MYKILCLYDSCYLLKPEHSDSLYTVYERFTLGKPEDGFEVAVFNSIEQATECLIKTMRDTHMDLEKGVMINNRMLGWMDYFEIVEEG